MRPSGRTKQMQSSSLQGVAGVIIAQVMMNGKRKQLEATDPALVEAINREFESMNARIAKLEEQRDTRIAELEEKIRRLKNILSIHYKRARNRRERTAV